MGTMGTVGTGPGRVWRAARRGGLAVGIVDDVEGDRITQVTLLFSGREKFGEVAVERPGESTR